jgi:hypothetical protein
MLLGCEAEVGGDVMRMPTENIFIKSHIAGSIATLVCGGAVFFICLVPTVFPAVYQLIVDDRVGIVIPYLLFIALGESVFSIWYFIFRKK